MAEEIFKGGPLYNHADGVFKPGADSMLLGSFARMGRVKRFCELGCGGGIVTLMLLDRAPSAYACAVDISGDAVRLCRSNLELNGMNGDVIQGDIREYRGLLPAGSFDLAVCNPPYFVPGRGRAPRDAASALARGEEALSLSELCGCAAYILRFGGRFCLVYRPERLSELFCAMTAAGIEPKRLRMCASAPDRAPSLVLVEGVRGGAPGLAVEKTELIK